MVYRCLLLSDRGILLKSYFMTKFFTVLLLHVVKNDDGSFLNQRAYFMVRGEGSSKNNHS